MSPVDLLCLRPVLGVVLWYYWLGDRMDVWPFVKPLVSFWHKKSHGGSWLTSWHGKSPVKIWFCAWWVADTVIGQVIFNMISESYRTYRLETWHIDKGLHGVYVHSIYRQRYYGTQISINTGWVLCKLFPCRSCFKLMCKILTFVNKKICFWATSDLRMYITTAGKENVNHMLKLCCWPLQWQVALPSSKNNIFSYRLFLWIFCKNCIPKLNLDTSHVAILSMLQHFKWQKLLHCRF